MGKTERGVPPAHQIQVGFLKKLERESTPVVVKLMTGEALEGVITGSDIYTFVLATDRGKVLVFKHGACAIFKKPVRIKMTGKSLDAVSKRRPKKRMVDFKNN